MILSALGALLMTVVGAAEPAGVSEATITRLVMLPVVGRTTIVIELSEAVAHVDHVQPVPTEVVIEGGPVSPRMRARRLGPSSPHPFVLGVFLSSLTKRDGASHFQVRIMLAAATGHQLRAVGSRLYVDLSPSAAPTIVSASVPSQDVRPFQADNSRPSTARSDATTPTPPTRTPGAIISPGEPQPSEQVERRPQGRSAPATNPEIDTEQAYRDLESSMLRRARELAGRPDVKRLLRLREEVEKRDTELGKRQPDLIGRLLDELSRITDQARALRLERDRGSFIQKP